jgi:hypothetical protein
MILSRDPCTAWWLLSGFTNTGLDCRDQHDTGAERQLRPVAKSRAAVVHWSAVTYRCYMNVLLTRIYCGATPQQSCADPLRFRYVDYMKKTQQTQALVTTRY